MRRAILRFGVVLFSIFTLHLVQAQLTVTNSLTPDQIAGQLSGEGVEISNVNVNAHPDAWGYYYSNGTEIGSSEGLILTTGKINNAIGPNNSTGLPLVVDGVCQNCNLFDNGFPGSALLNTAQSTLTFDAAQFQFDIVPQGDSLKFNFTFASEEYLEWVGSPFNDVFGFYISGTNVGTNVNIALIPNTSQTVAINTVNHLTNTQFFYNNQNPLGQGVQYDGFTVDLTAKIGNLIPCEVYTLTLVIADGSDRIYDSAVFVEKIESNPVQVITTTAGGLDYMIEGCNEGTITFMANEMNQDPIQVTYWIGGTATGGSDYTPALGTGSLIDPLYITIPAGQQSVSLNIQSIADGLDEGSEYIAIYLVNPMCTNATVDSVLFYIEDFLTVNLNPPLSQICIGDCVQLESNALTEGLATFSWDPTSGLSDTDVTNPLACPQQNVTYTITSEVSDCLASAEATIVVSDIQLALTPNEVNCDNAPLGTIDVVVSGTIFPVTYAWTGPNGFSSSNQNLTGLYPGTYCLTVTDELGCQATSCATIIQLNELDITSISLSDYTCFPISCFGVCDGIATASATGGSGAYTITWNGIVTNNLTATGLCAGVNTIQITDEAGCVVTESVNLAQPEPLVIEVVGVVNVLCSGEETGLATVSTLGGCPPYFYSWSHDPNLTAPVATNLGSGIYTVTVNDINGCSSVDSAEIEIGEPGEPITVVADVQVYPNGFNVSCAGASDGNINLTVAGGTPGYSYVWVDTNGFFVSNAEDLTNVPCGNYAVTITDSNGCIFTQSFSLTCAPPLVLQSSSVTPNPCASPNAGQGAIDITVSGGFANYSYLWSGPGCAPCTTEDLSGLNSGTYTLVVTDAQGCTLTSTFTVGEAPGISVIGSSTPATCFDSCNGSINITATSQSGSSFDFEWTFNGAPFSNNEDLVGLCAGIYQVTVSQQNCIQTATFIVNQPTAIVFNAVQTTPNPCDQPNAGQGAIDITASGGTGQLSYTWVGDGCAPCTTEDISGLNSGNYSLVITDEAGCTFSTIISVPNSDNITITETITPGGCTGLCDGSITIGVFSPAGGPYTFVWTLNGNFFSNDQNISGLCTGAYQVTVSEAGCTQVVNFNLEQLPELVVEQIAITPNPCNSPLAGLGAVSVITSGGTGAITYSWTGPGCAPCVGADLTGLNSGTYTLTISDEAGCQLTTDVVVGTSPGITITGTNTQSSCFNDCDGSINISATSLNNGPYSYSWTLNGNFYSNDINLTNLCAGTYVVTVSEQNCVETATFVITQPSFIDIELVQLTNPLCFGQNNGSLSVTATGGVGVLTYQWLPLGFFPGSNTQTITNLFEGTYTVIVTDETGCSEQQSFTLTAPTLLDIFVSTTGFNGGFNISCFGENDGAINVSVSNGTPPYSYDWSNPGCDQVTQPGSANQSGLPAGTYCVVVTDFNGCIATTEIPLTQPEELVVAGSVSNYNGFGVSCFGSNDGFISPSVIGGNGNYTSYIWSGPIGNNSPDAATLFYLIAGTYTLTVTDSNGCSDSFTYVITQPQPVVISVLFTQNVSCNGANDGIISVDVTGGAPNYTFEWTDAQGINYTGTVLTNLPVGTYILTVTDANGCQAIQVVNITQPEPFNVSLFSPVQGQNPLYNVPCVGDETASIITTIEGGVPVFDFTWTGTGINPNTLNQENLGAGTYCISVTDAIGCVTDQCITITEPEFELDATTVVSLFPSGFNISCFGACDGFIDVTPVGGTPGYTYVWQNSDGEDLGFSEDLLDICAATYGLAITDSNNCSVSLFFDLTQPDEIVATADISDYDNSGNVSCPDASDGSLTLDVSGGSGSFTIIWDPVQPDPLNLSGLSAGQYTATITDSYDCEVEAVFNLVDPQPLSFDPSITNVTCNGLSNGAISANPSGGTGNYTITWDGLPNTTANLTGIEAGTYTINITDGNDCTLSQTFVVSQPIELTAGAVTTDATCGASDGAIDMTIGGGTGAYSISWNGPVSIPVNTEDPQNLPSGNYTATVTDANLCTTTINIQVDGPANIQVDGTVTNVLCYGTGSGTISLEVENAIGDVTVEWFDILQNPVGTGTQIDNLPLGTFFYELTDELGCQAFGSFTLFQPDSLSISFEVLEYTDGYNVSDYLEDDGSIDVEVLGGTPDYEITWTGPTTIIDGELNPNNLLAGEYLLTITDANGCVKDTLIVLTQPDDIRLSSGFSPNGDGTNDNYVIPGLDQHPENTFKVFNRWGNIVYNITNYNNEWFGQNNNGEPLPDGTYFVIFESTRDMKLSTYVDLRR